MTGRPALLAGMIVALCLFSGTVVASAGGPICYPPVAPMTPCPPPGPSGPLPAISICPQCPFESLLEGTVDLAASTFAIPFKILDSCQDKFIGPPECLPGPVQQYRPPYCPPLYPVPAWRPAPMWCPMPMPVCAPMQHQVRSGPPMRYGPVGSTMQPPTPVRPAPYGGQRQMVNNSPIQLPQVQQQGAY
jgi:hypothetical protein